MLAIHSSLLAYSAYVHSPTLNEPSHLVAGLSYWKFGRFELYRINPPLVRLVAALPVIAAGYEEDWSGYFEGPGAMPVFGMGVNFVAANGERTFHLTTIARWACIPFSWIGAITCFLWARDLYGRPAGLLAAAIWCFEPNILAHASLITSDVAGTALGVAACYSFWRWLKRPTWKQAAQTGVILGLAELAKTTLLVFYPLWPLMWLAYRWPDRRAMEIRAWLCEAGMLAFRMIIGLYVLNLGYGFEGSFQQLKTFHFVSQRLTGYPPNSPASQGGAVKESNATSILNGQSPPVDSYDSTNRFAGTWLGELPVPLPKHYFLGLDHQQKSFENWERPAYLHGQWRDTGWWYYYLYAALIKMPLALWLLGLVALTCRFPIERTTRLPKTEGSGEDSAQSPQLPVNQLRDELVLLFPPLFIFAFVSAQTEINEHFRYVLPSFPYFFIAISQVAQLASPRRTKVDRFWIANNDSSRYNADVRRSANFFASGFMTSLVTPFIAVLITWLATTSLWIYPHSLSYFNESIGGPINGPEHLLGSNVDWGQDFRYLQSWLRRNSAGSRSTINYFGGEGINYFATNSSIVIDSATSTVGDSDRLTYLVSSVNALSKPEPPTSDPVPMPRGQLPDELRGILSRSTTKICIAYTIHACRLDVDSQSARLGQ